MAGSASIERRAIPAPAQLGPTAGPSSAILDKNDSSPPARDCFLFVVCSDVKMQNQYARARREIAVDILGLNTVVASPGGDPCGRVCIINRDIRGGCRQTAKRHVRCERCGCAAGIMTSSGNQLALRRTALVAPQHKGGRRGIIRQTVRLRPRSAPMRCCGAAL